MIRICLLTIAITCSYSAYGLNAGKGCWSAYKYNDKGNCSDKCSDLTFDCSKHQVMAHGQTITGSEDSPDSIDTGQSGWLGCASQTGVQGKQGEHKIVPGQHCGSGNKGLLGADQPKLDSDVPPCNNCVIHPANYGSDTKGCLGIEPKLFEWVATNCVGCPYKIIPMGKGDGKSSSGTPKGPTKGRRVH